MDRFERRIAELFDYNRFEAHPEFEKLIGNFEKEYPGGEKESGKREPVSFKELQSEQAETPSRRSTAPPKELNKKQDKGKLR